MTTGPTHPDVIEHAGRGYLAHLRSVEPEISRDGRLGIAVRHLIDLHEAAIRSAADLRAGDVAFRRSDLTGMAPWQLAALVDQHGLGLGRDDASLIFMGTEEAYDVVDGGDLALACCLTPLWLSGSAPDVLNAIDPAVMSNARSPRPRPYHLHPNDYYRTDLDRGRGTWACIARVLCPSDPDSLLRPPAEGTSKTLGDLCYQIDVSATPSKVASSGLVATLVRTRFLEHLVSSFDTARALVFHGGQADESRKSIASAFLGRPVRWQMSTARREWLAWDVQDERAVLHTYALNGRVTYHYLGLVRNKLVELAPTAMPL
jgi:hypothetical protein